MIEIKELCRIFSTDEVETTALNNINITIEKGEFVAITGPSGSGKSTLLHMLGLLDEPSSGSYSFLGTDTAGLKGRARAQMRKRHIGFIFQNFNLIDQLTVYENVSLPLIYQGVKGRRLVQLAEKALTRVEMMHRRNHFPRQLSGGQQQRVAVARAVVGQPDLLLADEPTGNLDSRNGFQVLSLLKELNRDGTAIVMVTHSKAQAEAAARRIHLVDGKVLAQHAVEAPNVA